MSQSKNWRDKSFYHTKNESKRKASAIKMQDTKKKIKYAALSLFDQYHNYVQRYLYKGLVQNAKSVHVQGNQLCHFQVDFPSQLRSVLKGKFSPLSRERERERGGGYVMITS